MKHLNKHVAVLKEGELNRKKERFFTEQIYEGRLNQTTMEHNLKRFLKYMPLTSMAMNGDELQKFLLGHWIRNN